MSTGCPDCGLAPHQIVGFAPEWDQNVVRTRLRGYCNDCNRDWSLDARVPLRDDVRREK